MLKSRIKNFEAKVAKFLNKYPFFKDFLRNVRHRIFKKSYRFYLHERLSLLAVPSQEEESSFFGYYTNSVSSQDKLFLFHTCKANDRIPDTLTNPASINVVDLDDLANSRKIASTCAWNWQQGSMLQWFNTGDDTIIFNDYDKASGKYYSKVMDVNSGETLKSFELPYYTKSRNCKFVLSLNFERLAKYRPEYGYYSHSSSELNSEENDGIWYIDSNSGEVTQIVSLIQLKNLGEPLETANHWVNHIQINPSDSGFLFLHRWKINSHSFKSRLVYYDLSTNELSLVLESRNISHYDWFDNDSIFIWCEIDGVSGYKFLNVRNGQWRSENSEIFLSDGHPSYSPNRNYLLTDTYPNRSRMSKLGMLNLSNSNFLELGEFYQPLAFNDLIRCDLHPRWGDSSDYITFDSTHSGKREMYILNVKAITNEK